MAAPARAMARAAASSAGDCRSKIDILHLLPFLRRRIETTGEGSCGAERGNPPRTVGKGAAGTRTKWWVRCPGGSAVRSPGFHTHSRWVLHRGPGASWGPSSRGAAICLTVCGVRAPKGANSTKAPNAVAMTGRFAVDHSENRSSPEDPGHRACSMFVTFRSSPSPSASAYGSCSGGARTPPR